MLDRLSRAVLRPGPFFCMRDIRQYQFEFASMWHVAPIVAFQKRVCRVITTFQRRHL